MPRSVKLDELTREEIAAVAVGGLVVLPVGAIEQHGLHLPLCTDAVIVEEIALRSAAAVQEFFPTVVAPVLYYGNSHHHFPRPAMSLTSEVMLSVLKDLLRSLKISGFQHIMILNSHGGNDEVIRIAARDIARECQVNIAAASYWTIAWEALQKECQAMEQGRVPGHAGSFETSIMLHLRPNLVRKESFPSQREDEIPKQEMSRRLFIQRPGNSVGQDGYSDDARFATKEKGAKMLAVIVREVAGACRKFMGK